MSQFYNHLSLLQSLTNMCMPFIFLIAIANSIFWAYKLFNSPKEKEALHAWYKRKLWRSMGLIVLVPVLWAAVGFTGSIFSINQGGFAPTLVSSSIAVPQLRFGEGYPYYQQPSGSIADTRDFTKISYTGNIKTREVDAVARKVKLLIKGVGGRIDSSNVSKQNANFTFVVPKSEYDDFESEISTYAHAKLYSRTETTQNKLADKQALERNQASSTKALVTLTVEQQKVKDTYTKGAKSLQSQIKAQKNALRPLQESLSQATTTEDIVRLQSQIAPIASTISRLEKDLSVLTSNFKVTMSKLGASVESQEQTLSDLAKATEDFLNDVETVQGYIYINYVSVLEIIFIFSPIDPLLILGVIILLLIGFSIYSNYKTEKELLGQ